MAEITIKQTVELKGRDANLAVGVIDSTETVEVVMKCGGCGCDVKSAFALKGDAAELIDFFKAAIGLIEKGKNESK